MGYAIVIPVLGSFSGHVEIRASVWVLLTAVCDTQPHAFVRHMVRFVHCKQTRRQFAKLGQICMHKRKVHTSGWREKHTYF